MLGDTASNAVLSINPVKKGHKSRRSMPIQENLRVYEQKTRMSALSTFNNMKDHRQAHPSDIPPLE